jgi:hypothetical protein
MQQVKSVFFTFLSILGKHLMFKYFRLVEQSTKLISKMNATCNQSIL